MPRVFIAIKLPEDICLRIDEFNAKNVLSKINNVKPVERENLHITIKFLGEISQAVIPKIIDELNRISKEFPQFKVKVKGIGVFPSPDVPRVIWVGAESSEIHIIKKSVDESLSRFGFEKDEKFISHITIGRVKRGNPAEKLKELMRSNIDFGEFTAKELVLFESILTPQRPIYKEIKTFVLGGN